MVDAKQIIEREIQCIPRRSLPQNIYRMAYRVCRSNGLGKHPEIGPTLATAHATALACVLQNYPDFEPTLRLLIRERCSVDED